MVKYNIISTGSDGNATILEEFVLIDCGVPYKALEPYVSEIHFVDMRHPDYTPAFLNTPLILGQMGLIYRRK